MFNLDKKPDYQKIEEEILEFWNKNKIFEGSIERRPKDKPFVFYEGPPTANGKPGIHHVLARAYKDVVCRYKTMRGYQVKRQAGWDTHGLPVELEVEKELGISGKGEIEKLVPGSVEKSIIKFNQLCKESVFKYRQDWEKLTERIGFWIDMDNAFITYQNSYIEKVWGIIKKIWDKKFLYQGHKVLPYCYRCGTALSSHEVAQGYKNVTEPSIYVKFKLKRKNNLYLLAWTTTPWTLPGHMILYVSKTLDYAQVKIGKDELILADKLVGKVLKGEDYKVIKKLKGSQLIGLKYQPPYDVTPKDGKDKHRVAEADFVKTDEGTGIVHSAVMYGEEDYELGKRADIPKFHTVDKSGRFIKEVAKFKGQNVHQAAENIIKDLKARGLLLKQLDYTHSYPFCWRCRSQLIYYAKEGWFIKMSALRSQLKANNQQINWVPRHIKNGRFGKWLEDVKDWAFSRERYWGTPLPIWQCRDGCGNIKVVGSTDELSRLSIQSIDLKNLDLHRPYIDKIKLKCEKCGKQMTRDKAVIDVWFDSGAMPFASGAEEKLGYPADYITEAIDQTRGWFYTLLAISTLLDKGICYKNVISLGHILDEKGQKMSKSLGNITEPNEILNKYGADNLRFYFFSVNQASATKRFREKDLLTCARKNLMMLWNMVLFFKTYSKIDGWKFSNGIRSQTFLDKWLLERTDRLAGEAAKSMDDYQITDASRQIEDYIQELSTWYLRLSRKRRSKDFYDNFFQALRILIKILSPFMPFTADYLHQNLKSDKTDSLSVHLANFPKSAGAGRENLEKAKKMQGIIRQVAIQRNEQSIRLRQPLNKLEVRGSGLEVGEEELEILKQETNVLKIEIKKSSKEMIALDTRVTPQLRQLGVVRDLKRQIQNIRKKADCKLDDKVKLMLGFSQSNQWIKKHFKEIEKDTLVEMVSQIKNPDIEDSGGGFEFKLKK